MAQKGEEIWKRPLYAFDLPQEILTTIQPKGDALARSTGLEDKADDRLTTEQRSTTQDASRTNGTEDDARKTSTATSCALCGVSYATVQEQRDHVRSDFHGYNVKQKIKGARAVTETEFEKLVDDLNESISGSDSSDSDEDEDNAKSKDNMLIPLLKKQANISNDDEDDFGRPRKRGSGKQPLLWFTSPSLPSNTSMGIYRAIFTDEEQDEEGHIVDTLRNKQLAPIPVPKASSTDEAPAPSPLDIPHVFLCMTGGGHFAAMIVSLAPKVGKKGGVEERQATVLAHKTFHRYTTRRKQGGAQSANDSAKGAAHSAGSSLRRYNEAALTAEVRQLLLEWKDLIDTSQLLFIRATGTTSRRTLFGPYDGQILRHNDPRIRGFPFSTRRATQSELMRAFIELTRVKVSQVDEAALAAAEAAQASKRPSKPSTPKPSSGQSTPAKPSKEDEDKAFHTSQLQSLIRRQKAPGVLSYLSKNSIPKDFTFFPASTQQNHHAPTPLHLAASVNSPAVVIALLTKSEHDPTILNGEGKTPFDLAGDRSTRDAFRVARHELGENRWDWEKSRIPQAMSKTDADRREERERKQADDAESERRRVEKERLRREAKEAEEKETARKMAGGRVVGNGTRIGNGPSGGLGILGQLEKTATERREEEMRGMTPEMRMRLERERRARAAEERIRRMQQRG
ncbi:hypothetical protein L228DRAFT_247454 [Xylona heveae TC161]|uniref:VLRF1 domain-containing protein n=1 Tax=Xylona heveae (strain CBS 132557 / TC161) TaxID=1328760 RepID=A0A165H5H1_XYLHT|nr:hypothetical protein L228DRAFT_247454 [Xylona heveae TC161]KZF23012.1 hypothetical protein L228DRAFT_247454 [Xylona heveae TC161]